MIRAVLFDLDGTLLDTAGDLILAINQVRRSMHMDEVPVSQVRPWVSKGGVAMVRAAFPHLTDLERTPLLPIFLEQYHSEIVVHTRLFDGFEAVLDALAARSMELAIVTNKPTWLTLPVLEKTALTKRFPVVICGDTLAEKKPHPAQVLEACRRLGVAPAEAVMVGDDQRDIDAARAAGSPSIAVRFGYAAEEDRIDSWLADVVIDHPSELLTWLDQDATHGT